MNDLKWFACELHCHTRHSDGNFTPRELLKTAHSRGLDGICLTDHNTASGWAEVQKSLEPVVLCGIEWTTYYGHMLVLDCDKYVDWRDAKPDNIDEKIKEVHASGGLVGVAHPFQLGTPICTGGYWEYNVHDWSQVNYIELWSEGEPHVNTCNSRAIAMWNGLLDRGYRIAPTFGRDWHSPENNMYPSACTYLGCRDDSISPKAMKEAIKNGHTVISAGPMLYAVTDNGKTAGDVDSAGERAITFKADFNRMKNTGFENEMTPQAVRIITNGGKMLGEWEYRDSLTVNVRFSANSWYSAELWGKIDGRENCMLAKTSPIYT